MMKKPIALLLMLAAVFSLAACSSAANRSETNTPSPSASASAAAETPTPAPSAPAETNTPAPQETPAGSRMYTDDCGRQVEIPAVISRFVPSGSMAQIVLFAIAPEMFVGFAAEWDDAAKGMIPDQYFDLPYFGQLYGTADLNVEELAKSEPQLIIDVGEAKKSIVEDMDMLQTQTTIPAIHIDASLATMPDAFRKLGELLGKEEKGEELAQFCEKTYSRTLKIMDNVGEKNKVKALYITGEQGLNVLAKTSFHAELIDMLVDNLAVVENPSGKGSGNEVTMDQLLIWNPDFIIFAPQSIYSTVGETETWNSKLPQFRTTGWAHLPLSSDISV
jgi:iron complex transport system substrate-binding protein